MAACNEEKQLAELKKRKQYKPTSRNKGRDHAPKPARDKQGEHKDSNPTPSLSAPVTTPWTETQKCFQC